MHSASGGGVSPSITSVDLRLIIQFYYITHHVQGCAQADWITLKSWFKNEFSFSNVLMKNASMHGKTET